MARPSKPSAAKRERERAKLTKNADKKARRATRKEEKAANLLAGIDPNAADFVDENPMAEPETPRE